MSTELSDKERLRYSRHLLLNEVSEAGQLRLKQARVAVVGCGGLGSPALFYLAASGVGQLTFCDDDAVELSNLQRQILYKISHIGQPKAKAAGKVLASLNNQISLIPQPVKLNSSNIDSILQDSDWILDCSDNFATRYLLNQYCVQQRKVLISGAALGTQGQFMTFDFRKPSPCYHCIFPQSSAQPILNCQNAGVVSPLLGIIGSMQAMKAVSLIISDVPDKHSEMIVVDALSLKQRQFTLERDTACDVCG
ncbi:MULTISPECIES: HesA/MoeB/ThiF family protein [unclassified Pseudoalteromonas]|uniref:HesA/MoeB/ThiF family protein n=1 Tax=unclassified Pseudoalteromonas TaxID=194690 RepID=UPI002097BDBD|nr:HesA/MoeB/ThiF family protein [Pseudoalteromonas sp. XMcav2-N]MCO7189823.1 HesA/MoeB/ThiF family protein [Pseudoalteromonas sp. XMcav2-N]